MERFVRKDYQWPGYVRAIQGHTNSDPSCFDHVEFTEETSQFVYHVGYEEDWNSILDQGLRPGFYGSRSENHLSAGHPVSGRVCQPGVQRQMDVVWSCNP